MRSTNEIIIAVKDSQPVTEEELKMALLVMSSVRYFEEKKIRDIIYGDNIKELFAKADAARTLESMRRATNECPLKWLGDSIPGNPKFEQIHRVGKTLLEKFEREMLGEELKED